ncbi:MAG: hypothetical protein Fur0022_30620 [Anaerolineales bacterium]
MIHKNPFFILLFSIFVLAACAPEQNNIPEEVFTTYETATYKISLSENYLGADPKTPSLNVLTNWMLNNGYDAQGFSKFIQANAAEISYVGINTEITATNIVTYFTLAGGEKPDAFSVDNFEQNYNETVGADRFIRREQKDLGEHRVQVLYYQFTQGGTTYLNSFYFLETDTQFWKFEFITPEPDYADKIAGFEQIVAEFEPRSP